MKPQLIIQLGDSNADSVRWMRVDSEKGATPIATGTLNELALQTQGAQIVVLVPTTEILLTRTAVPTTNRQRMLKAIPFALEDQLAGNVDDLHFALGERNADGEIAVAVVSNELMDRWQNRCRDAGLQPHYVIPDLLALPYAEGQWSLFVGARESLLRVGPQTGVAMDTENAEFMCALNMEQIEDDEQRPKVLRVWRNESTEFDFGFEGVEVRDEVRANSLLDMVAAEARPIDLGAAINLLQGPYSRREQLGKLWRPWRVAASLAGVWFVIQVGITIIDNLELSAQKDALRVQVEQIYKEAFPGTTRIVNPKVQMERKLQELRGGDSGAGKQFLALLADTGAVLRQSNGVVIRNVRYKNSEMDLELEVPNLQVLDQLKNKLTAENKLTVEIQSAASKDDKVQGRLHIKSIS